MIAPSCVGVRMKQTSWSRSTIGVPQVKHCDCAPQWLLINREESNSWNQSYCKEMVRKKIKHQESSSVSISTKEIVCTKKNSSPFISFTLICLFEWSKSSTTCLMVSFILRCWLYGLTLVLSLNNTIVEVHSACHPSEVGKMSTSLLRTWDTTSVARPRSQQWCNQQPQAAYVIIIQCCILFKYLKN